MKTILTFALATLLVIPPSLWSAEPAPTEAPPPQGIRTDFGDVLIENLGIGRTYNLRDLAGKPLNVKNHGRETLNLLIDVQIPDDSTIPPERKEMGFKPIPSLDWVTVSQGQFILPSGESAYTDVVIKIPDDPKLYGKKFQASIYSRSVGSGFLHVGVWSHLMFTIALSPEAQAEQEKNKKRGFIGSMDYSLLPDKVVVQNVPLGQKIDLAKDIKRTIKLANSGNDPIELRVKVVPVGDSPVGLQEGFEEAGGKWLTTSAPTIKVEPSSFADPGLVLEIPNDPKLRGKKIMFVIKVEPADAEMVGVTYYGKVYAELQK